MSYTLDENGKALSETKAGISRPIDNSFESVNNWVHGTDVQYEELESVCLGLASENDRLREKLKIMSSTIALIDMNVRKKDWPKALEHCLNSRRDYLGT